MAIAWTELFMPSVLNLSSQFSSPGARSEGEEGEEVAERGFAGGCCLGLVADERADAGAGAEIIWALACAGPLAMLGMSLLSLLGVAPVSEAASSMSSMTNSTLVQTVLRRVRRVSRLLGFMIC